MSVSLKAPIPLLPCLLGLNTYQWSTALRVWADHMWIWISYKCQSPDIPGKQNNTHPSFSLILLVFIHNNLKACQSKDNLYITSTYLHILLLPHFGVRRRSQCKPRASGGGRGTCPFSFYEVTYSSCLYWQMPTLLKDSKQYTFKIITCLRVYLQQSPSLVWFKNK